MSPSRLHRFRPALLALGCAMLLVACGGAGEMGSGGTGAAAEGTVTGFGSIFVDGVRFDDSNATVKVDGLADLPDDGETRLGQRVEVSYSVDGVAQSVKIEPEVVGLVTETSETGFKVLGQTVAVNSDPAAGPVTQFGGYASLLDVKVADPVEVHGVLRNGAPGSVIQATRVEKRTVPLPYLRVAGKLAGPAAGPRFMLGTLAIDATGARVLPAGRPLAVGQSVVVFAPADALTTVGGQPTLAAARVLVRVREGGGGAVPALLGGVVSNRTADSFDIGDVTVRTSAGTATVTDGQYVQVRGDFNADGDMVATDVNVRGGVLDADLRGTVVDFNAVAKTFGVRGVTVRIGSVVPVDCPVDLSGQYVEVSGRIGPGGVDAQSIRCENAPTNAVVERRGTASNVVTSSNTFDLATPERVTVRWTPLTFFADNLRRTEQSLNAQPLRVEGRLVGGVLVASKIRLDR